MNGFRTIREKTAESQFSAVFLIKNTRKQDIVILIFLTERILYYDHIAKEKIKKS